MILPASNCPGTLTTPERIRTATFNVRGKCYDRGPEVTRLHPALLAIGAAGLPEFAGGNCALTDCAAGSARGRGPGFTAAIRPGDFHPPFPGRGTTDYTGTTPADLYFGGSPVRVEHFPRDC